ncbi:MAG: helix-turn-helix domain-containing protein, partial [Planctomycetaceae bacterium]|nr:helix-turn-helix domain-containing protein [Planctomycetaceae bacterium]
MSDPQSFQALIDRVRTGDVQAAEELVRRYEPTIRRVARVRLVDPRLRRQLDTMDICQSVLGSFFVRAALGEYDLGSPDQLLRLLAAMTRNKLANQKRHQRAARRDYRRVEPGG